VPARVDTIKDERRTQAAPEAGYAGPSVQHRMVNNSGRRTPAGRLSFGLIHPAVVFLCASAPRREKKRNICFARRRRGRREKLSTGITRINEGQFPHPCLPRRSPPTAKAGPSASSLQTCLCGLCALLSAYETADYEWRLADMTARYCSNRTIPRWSRMAAKCRSLLRSNPMKAWSNSQTLTCQV